jgi:hypothetical protein
MNDSVQVERPQLMMVVDKQHKELIALKETLDKIKDRLTYLLPPPISEPEGNIKGHPVGIAKCSAINNLEDNTEIIVDVNVSLMRINDTIQL